MGRTGDFLTLQQTRRLGAKSNLVGIFLVLHAWALIAGSMALFAWWPNPVTFLLGVMVIGGRQLGLARNRRDVCKLLWSLWSPEWKFDDATFEKTAASFDNPDFVDVVIQSYRHRYGYTKGDPALEPLEAKLAKQPGIAVPTINLHGTADGVGPAADRDGQSDKFTGGYERRMLPRIGHNVPQEAPAETVAALRDLMKGIQQ